jgi:hypothetical protein
MAGCPKLTDQQREQRRAEDRERLQAAARALLDSDGWARWVRVRATNGLARYSMRNVLLLALQTEGNASYVAGFKGWLALGYCVRRGEKALRIFAPMPRRRRDDAEQADPGAGVKGDDERGVIFTTTAVFDRAQVDPLPDVDPTPLDAPCEPLSGDSHAHLRERLADWCRSELGYNVEIRPVAGPTGGWCDTKARAIVVDATGAPNAQLRTLIHEAAHAMGVDYRSHSRERAEVIVESVSFIVASSVGLDLGGESIPYVAGWGEDDAVQAATEFAEIIDGLTRRLEEVLITPPAAAAGDA